MISKVRTKAPAAGGLLNRDLCVFHLIKAQVSAVELSRTLALSTNWHLTCLVQLVLAIGRTRSLKLLFLSRRRA